MISSSIRFSLVGAQVGCTTNTSRARTFCWISTSTSPSEKRPTVALPSSTPRCVRDLLRQRRVGVAGEQHGVEQHGAAGARQVQSRREDLAGEEGLEPSHVGIKIRCLNQLGDSPTQVAGSRPHPRNRLSLPSPPADARSRLRHMRPTQLGGKLDPRRQVANGSVARAGSREHRAARTRHAAVAEARLQANRPLGATSAHCGLRHRLQVVAPESRSGAVSSAAVSARKPASITGGCRALQRRAAEDLRGGQRGRRLDHRQPLRAAASIGVRRSPMPSTKALLAADEERHVGAQRQRQRSRRSRGQSQAPQPVQRQQRGGGVGTAAAQAGAPRHALVD